MFVPYKSDDGALIPWEYLAAAAATYKAGQLLTVTSGKLAAIAADSTALPPYLCMADQTAEAGDLLPVQRISKTSIYETTLSAAAAGAVVGGKLQIAAGGEFAKAGAGAFEIVSIDGTAVGDAVFGRWVEPPATV